MKEEKIGNKREQSAANPPKEFRTSIGFDKISYSEDEDSVMIGIQDDERKKKMALIMNIMMQKNNKEDVNAQKIYGLLPEDFARHSMNPAAI